MVQRHGAWRRRSMAGACLLLAGVLGCDMFSVRDAEEPSLTVTEDPLNFGGLLDGTSERFDRLHYDELFAESFEYRQGTSAPKYRSEFTSRLRAIEGTHPDIAVEWARTDSALFSRIEGYTVELDSALYYVYLTGDRTGAPDFSGYSDIGLRYMGYWAIMYWTDFPAATVQGYSFFNPDFRSSP